MKPILFNTEMVKAILDGRKTVTRRAIKPRYRDDESGFIVEWNTKSPNVKWLEKIDEEERCFDPSRYINSPYNINDILYVRETWQQNYDGTYEYRAGHKFECEKGWRPSIHMPQEAARILLRVTDVRVERLQDITDDEAKKEGANYRNGKNVGWEEKMKRTAVQRFAEIWNSTIKSKDCTLYSWEANPWVWVIEFERITKEEVKDNA